MVLFGKREGGKFRERVRGGRVCVGVAGALFQVQMFNFVYRIGKQCARDAGILHCPRSNYDIISMKLKLAFCTAGIRDLCHGYNAKDVEKKSASWVRETAGLQSLDKPRITDKSIQCKF